MSHYTEYTVRLTFFGLMLVGSSALAQENRFIDDPTLNEVLMRHSDRKYPSKKPFPREYLSCDFYNAALIDLVIMDDDDTPKIILSSVRTTLAGYKLFPNIVHRADGGNWIRTPIPVTADGWTYVHVSDDRKHYFIAMDNRPESSGWETRFVISEDGGNVWSYGESVRKYVYFDVLRYFSFDELGAGTAVEYYEGDIGGYEEIGYYVFKTADWGFTWSEREYRSSFDTQGFEDSYQTMQDLRAGEALLSDIALPGFNECVASTG